MGKKYNNPYLLVAIFLILAGLLHFLSENKDKAPPTSLADRESRKDSSQEVATSSQVQVEQEDSSHHDDPDISIQLSIDNNSTMTSDIVKVWHDIDSKAICVQLKPDSRCPHPALVGRLSGPALAILDWKERASSDPGTSLCGGYGHYWLDAGYYFVEILITHCIDFGVNALERSNNLTEWLEANHRFDCVEDVNHNLITSSSRTRKEQPVIHISAPLEGRDSYHRRRWIRKQGLPSKPLFQRYQPVECFRDEIAEGSSMQKYCDSLTERDHDGTNGTETTGLYEYRFEWNMRRSEERLLEKLRRSQRTQSIPKMCAVGDSHSEYMVKQSLPILDLAGLFEFVRSPWIAPKGIAKKIADRNCDIFFIQVGQWPASKNTREHPFSFGKYHEKLKLLVQNILAFNAEATIYLPTIDQAPLMALISACYDWRTPTYLDGYSYVNQMVVQELNMPTQVKYLDTNFIIYSAYDGHEDWYQHLMEMVRSRKTLYVAAIMLGETEWFDE